MGVILLFTFHIAHITFVNTVNNSLWILVNQMSFLLLYQHKLLYPVHTGTISYRSTSVRSKKWYGEGLRSHGYGKNQAVRSKTGPEIGRYGKVNQKLERYDIVPFRSRVNRSGTISYRFPDLFGIYE